MTCNVSSGTLNLTIHTIRDQDVRQTSKRCHQVTYFSCVKFYIKIWLCFLSCISLHHMKCSTLLYHIRLSAVQRLIHVDIESWLMNIRSFFHHQVAHGLYFFGTEFGTISHRGTLLVKASNKTGVGKNSEKQIFYLFFKMSQKWWEIRLGLLLANSKNCIWLLIGTDFDCLEWLLCTTLPYVTFFLKFAM